MEKLRVKARVENPKLTVFDTGEMLEPKVWPDGTGSVDFDNDESMTEFTVCGYPSLVLPDTLVLEVDTQAAHNLKIVVNDTIVFTGPVS